MEKYGVDTETEEAKVASEKSKPTCPECGRELGSAVTMNVPVCPHCGTKPFEAKP